eukprot:1170547-Rhodomonas_salina.1
MRCSRLRPSRSTHLSYLPRLSQHSMICYRPMILCHAPTATCYHPTVAKWTSCSKLRPSPVPCYHRILSYPPRTVLCYALIANARLLRSSIILHVATWTASLRLYRHMILRYQR